MSIVHKIKQKAVNATEQKWARGMEDVESGKGVRIILAARQDEHY